jgi:hypothetical protein
LKTEAVAETFGSAANSSLIGIIIAQLFAGQIIKKIIPLFLTLQLNLHMMTNLNFPANVSMIFNALKDSIELKELKEMIFGALEESTWKETFMSIKEEAETSGMIVFVAPPVCILFLMCAFMCIRCCKKV